jgi:hypothetical protein
MSDRKSRLWPFVLLLLAGGCSTASEHEAVMTAFATATGQAASALREYDEAAAARVTELTRTDANELVPKGEARIGYPEMNCISSSADCELRLYAGSDQDVGRPLTVKSLIPKHVAAAEEIAAYAKALQEVAAADSTAEVSAALNQVSVTIGSLANLVQPGSAPAARAVTGPAANALSWVYGKYQENLKISALREATTAMDPTMQVATKEFARVETISSDAGINRRVAEFQDRLNAYNASRGQSDLAPLLSSQEDLKAALSASRGAVFEDLGKAHANLVQALTDKIDSFADVQAALDRVIKDAKDLHKIAEDLKEGIEAAEAANDQT